MNSHLRFFRLGILLVLFVSPFLAGGQESFVFSVPLIMESDVENRIPTAAFSFSETIPLNDSIAVQQYTVSLEGLNWNFGSASGLEFALEGNDYEFDSSAPYLPLYLRSLTGTAGFWHRFSECWTGEAGISRTYVSAEGTGGALGRLGFVRQSTQVWLTTYATVLKFKFNDSLRAYAGLDLTPEGQGKIGRGVAAGLLWKSSDRWNWSLGFPETTGAFQLFRNVYLYGGLVFKGALFNASSSVDNASGNTELRNFPITYREIDIETGLHWDIASHWRIDLSVGIPLYQKALEF